MQNFDFSPLYRTLVGFDRVADMIDEAARAEPSSQGYPPYNIEQMDENSYRIHLAVAGFDEADLDIEVREGVLMIKGAKSTDEEPREFLHRGIAERAFERRFQLADYVVVHDAFLENGMLQVDLRRELPEAMKPKTIKIGTNAKAKRLSAGKKPH